ncbi:MAG: hypothetical protein H7Z73_06005 [Candidatus Saccharibacteria bacterium]|nr:hypothetical protein [Moraxellaceae bacterium]
MTAGSSPKTPTNDVVYATCLLLVEHFRTLIAHDKEEAGFHTRIFSHMLHPEIKFVYAGQSDKVTEGTFTHPEHVVPCATLITECKRLIKAGILTNEAIASLLQKHWKVAHITQDEQQSLDHKSKFNYKSTMPDGWSFEHGETFARFQEANIVLVRES